MNIMMTGFEFGTLPKGWSLYGSGGIVAGGAYTGVYALTCPGNSLGGFANGGNYNIATPLAEFFFQFRYDPYSIPSGGCGIFKWVKGANVLGGIAINSAGKLDVYTGNFVTKVITGTTVISGGSYRQIEVHVKIDSSTGIIQLRLGGLAEGSDFSGNTKPGADTTVDTLTFGGVQTGGANYVDDCVLNDTTGARNNSWPDGWKMARLAPTGDDTPLQLFLIQPAPRLIMTR